ncbi:MAG TPA: S46 family peptidase [Pyrinomonadaceae bacterium]|nr:S46 family peptidase [Pyrinomonadaceae bacterium]
MLSSLARWSTFLLVLILVASAPARVFCDEGMFMPDTIDRLPIDKLKKRGLQIPVSDIYSPSAVSIKDAVVIVGGGTGEFVSPEGLLLTNHHVAFDALVAASEPGKDYATNGFSAHSRTDELPARGYTVTITQNLKNVTAEILAGVTNETANAQRTETIQANIQKLETAGTRAAEGVQVRVVAMNEGLLYYKLTYLVLRDVRIAYAPPKAIGFFGGDPDNFEWPRHCGDFAFMRVYTGPDGKPAPFSPNNVVFKPKKFLPLSTAGVKEGDFMMVMGYPGSTRRYRESYSVAYNQDVAQPFYVDVFDKQIEILKAIGENDPAARIKLQGTIFDLSNTQKNFDGSVLAMRRANIVEKKRAEEAAFTRWINESPARKTKYGEVLPSLAKAYDELSATSQRDLLVQQLASVSGLLDLASFAQLVAAEKEKPESERNPAITNQATLERALGRVAEVFADRNPTAEREMLVYLLKKAADLPPNQKIEALEKRFGSLQGEARRRAEADFSRSVIDSKRFATAESVAELLKLSQAQLRDLNEPLLDFAANIGELTQQARPRTQRFNATVARLRPLLLEGMGEMRGSQPYPDANRTLRFTYGEVKGYAPREAIMYSPFTTLVGVMEKDTGREPFDVPAKLKQLFEAHNFGSYGSPDGAAIPVDFLSTTDIIGGNSGSPILNGRGEQVGIIFDGNYEGLGNDFFYNETKARAIAVDIRYVLFLTEKFGDAAYLLKELEIRVRGSKSRRN